MPKNGLENAGSQIVTLTSYYKNNTRRIKRITRLTGAKKPSRKCRTPNRNADKLRVINVPRVLFVDKPSRYARSQLLRRQRRRDSLAAPNDAPLITCTPSPPQAPTSSTTFTYPLATTSTFTSSSTTRLTSTATATTATTTTTTIISQTIITLHLNRY